MFVLSALSKNTSFPAGFAAQSEAEALVQGGDFIGGLGLVQVGPPFQLAYAVLLIDTHFNDDSWFRTQRVLLVNDSFLSLLLRFAET